MNAKEEWLWFNSWRWSICLLSCSLLAIVSITPSLILPSLAPFFLHEGIFPELSLTSLLFDKLIVVLVTASVSSLTLHFLASEDSRGSRSSKVLAFLGLCFQFLGRLMSFSAVYSRSESGFESSQIFFDGMGIGMVLSSLQILGSLWFYDHPTLSTSLVFSSAIVASFPLLFLQNSTTRLFGPSSSFVMLLLVMLLMGYPVVFFLRDPPSFFVESLRELSLSKATSFELENQSSSISADPAFDADDSPDFEMDEVGHLRPRVATVGSGKTSFFIKIINSVLDALPSFDSNSSSNTVYNNRMISKLRQWRLKLRTMGKKRRGYGELVSDEGAMERDAIEMEIEDSFAPSEYPPRQSSTSMKDYKNGSNGASSTATANVAIIPSTIDDFDAELDADPENEEFDHFSQMIETYDQQFTPLDQQPQSNNQKIDNDSDGDSNGNGNGTEGVSLQQSSSKSNSNSPPSDLFTEIETQGHDHFSLAIISDASQTFSPIPLIDFLTIPNVWGLTAFFFFFVAPISVIIPYHQDMIMAVLHVRPEHIFVQSRWFLVAFALGFGFSPILSIKYDPRIGAKFVSGGTLLCSFFCIFARGWFFAFVFFILCALIGIRMTQFAAITARFFHHENVRLAFCLTFGVLSLSLIIMSQFVQIVRNGVGAEYYLALDAASRDKITSAYSNIFYMMLTTSFITFFWTKYFVRPLSETERFEVSS